MPVLFGGGHLGLSPQVLRDESLKWLCELFNSFLSRNPFKKRQQREKGSTSKQANTSNCNQVAHHHPFSFAENAYSILV